MILCENLPEIVKNCSDWTNCCGDKILGKILEFSITDFDAQVTQNLWFKILTWKTFYAFHVEKVNFWKFSSHHSFFRILLLTIFLPKRRQLKKFRVDFQFFKFLCKPLSNIGILMSLNLTEKSEISEIFQIPYVGIHNQVWSYCYKFRVWPVVYANY